MQELAAKAQAECDAKVKKLEARITRINSELEKAGYAGRVPAEKLCVVHAAHAYTFI